MKGNKSYNYLVCHINDHQCCVKSKQVATKPNQENLRIYNVFHKFLRVNLRHILRNIISCGGQIFILHGISALFNPILYFYIHTH